MNWLLQSERPPSPTSGHLPAEEQERNGLILPVAEESLRTLSSRCGSRKKGMFQLKKRERTLPFLCLLVPFSPQWMGWRPARWWGGVFPGCPESHAHVLHKHPHRHSRQGHLPALRASLNAADMTPPHHPSCWQNSNPESNPEEISEKPKWRTFYKITGV